MYACGATFIHPPPSLLPSLASADIALIGIEIMSEAKPVQAHPFRRKTALVAGNEGDGLSDKVKSMCDGFVYIE